MRKTIKGFVAVTLSACMCLSSTVMALAGNYDVSDFVDTSGYTSEDSFTCTGNTTFSATGNSTIGGINGGGFGVTINGGGTLNIQAPSGDGIYGAQSVSIQGTTVNITTGNDGAGIRTTYDGTPGVTINDSDVTITGGQYGICSFGSVDITNSSVTANTQNTSYGHAILAEGSSISITNSDVNASVRGEDAVFESASVNLTDCSVVSGSYAGSSVEIKKSGSTSSAGAACAAPAEDKKEDVDLTMYLVHAKTPEAAADSSSSSKTDASVAPAPAASVNPMDVVIQGEVSQTAYFSGALAGSTIRVGEVSPMAQGSFRAATPAGWTRGFSFSILTNGQPTYVVKNGKISFKIPSGYKKAGRKFALLGIDKNGKVKRFDNIDVTGESFIADLDIEGYEFELIYAD